MVAAAQRVPSNEGVQQRSTHAGAVGLVRKDRRGKSPLSLDVALDKLERMCISSAGRSSRNLFKGDWLNGSPSSIIARRRCRAGAHALPSIDPPIIIVDSCGDTSAPNAPRSGGASWGGGYLSANVNCPPLVGSSYSMPSAESLTSSEGSDSTEQQHFLRIESSPSTSP